MQQSPHWIPARIERPLLRGVAGPLLGAIFFFVMFDPKLLDPTYLDWLLSNDDSRMQLIGWRFFRLEPWHVPPGAATRYGMDIGSSIVFTDAVPLFAFLFKALRSLLPDNFQYMGLWILACYLAQGATAWLLSGTVTTRVLHRCLMVAFFVASPIMLNRAVAHHALMAHWLLLASLYLYMRREYSGLRWCLLVGAAALINAYLLYMTMAVWLGDLVRRLWADRALSWRGAARTGASVFTVLLCTMWFAGYFTLPVRDFSSGAAEYGRFAANLNSLWNPAWTSTLFMSPRPVLPGSEIEGSGYIGAGLLAMAPIAAIGLLRSRVSAPSFTRYAPLVVVALLLWGLALSHRVVWDDTVVITLPVPYPVLDVLAAIRSSARLLWVAYYGLMFAVLAIVATRFRPAVATSVLIAGLAIQSVDAFPRYAALRQEFRGAFVSNPGSAVTPLHSPFWRIAARHYRHILFVPVAHKPPHFDAFALFAADHGMAINVGYFGRVSNSRIDAANARLDHELRGGPLREDSLYMFWDGAPVEDSVRSPDAVGVVDGFTVIAPGWFEFADCCDEPTGVLHRGVG
jgi:Family of unknown function (DUF6311)